MGHMVHQSETIFSPFKNPAACVFTDMLEVKVGALVLLSGCANLQLFTLAVRTFDT